MAKRMSFSARWGSACGAQFVAEKFLTAHPQFESLSGLLPDRSSQPWTTSKLASTFDNEHNL